MCCGEKPGGTSSMMTISFKLTPPTSFFRNETTARDTHCDQHLDTSKRREAVPHSTHLVARQSLTTAKMATEQQPVAGRARLVTKSQRPERCMRISAQCETSAKSCGTEETVSRCVSCPLLGSILQCDMQTKLVHAIAHTTRHGLLSMGAAVASARTAASSPRHGNATRWHSYVARKLTGRHLLSFPVRLRCKAPAEMGEIRSDVVQSRDECRTD